ncbi:MAG: thioredoxin-dependent thiol peroxidase [Spirochaetales bacterium]|nr:thioredoxin-dependent thiol peroxidase [Spirochaetales bacterium]
MLNIGDMAPDFTLQDGQGKYVSLSDFSDRHVILYFYPKDDTPGCTKEACGFRDSYDQYLQANAVVLGISADSSHSHEKFSTKFKLPFPLLSDPNKDVIKLYEAWGIKKMYGKEYEGILRYTYVIGPDGAIVDAYEKVKPAEHAQQILTTHLSH